MENIFEDAQPGNKFKTRDGRTATLLSLSDYAWLSIETIIHSHISICCTLDGKVDYEYLSNDLDIVSRLEDTNKD